MRPARIVDVDQKPILTGQVGLRLRELVREICRSHDIKILKGHIRPDQEDAAVVVPVLLLSVPPTVSPSRVMNAIKGSLDGSILHSCLRNAALLKSQAVSSKVAARHREEDERACGGIGNGFIASCASRRRVFVLKAGGGRPGETASFLPPVGMRRKRCTYRRCGRKGRQRHRRGEARPSTSALRCRSARFPRRGLQADLRRRGEISWNSVVLQ
jgi:REP element-mobilizing transposase RayT